jgi:FkbM family methyltransferase
MPVSVTTTDVAPDNRASNPAPAKRSIFLPGIPIGKALRSVVARLFHLAVFLLRRRGGRYLLLSPIYATRQVLFDRKDKKLINIDIRDKIDFYTIGQIYLDEDYGLDKLRRRDDLMAYYGLIEQSGKTPLIIDCGGNTGLATRYFSENYPKAKIVCIEPDPSNLMQARKNNSSPNIVFMESAIGSEKSRGTIVDPGLGNNGYRISCAQDGATEIVSINGLLEQFSAKEYTPFIVKIDIEGFESELFSKNLEWIEKFPLLVIELHDWMLPRSSNANNFIKAIAPLNRDFVYHGENVFSISNTLV